MMEPVDNKRPGEKVKTGGAKRLKLESDETVWGEQTDHGDHDQQKRVQFLESGVVITGKTKQPGLKVLRGSEWIGYMLAKEIAWQAVDQAFGMEDVATWQEWTDDVPNSMIVNVQVESQECGTAQLTSDNTIVESQTKTEMQK